MDFRIDADGVTLAGEEAGQGPAGRAAARADRDAALRGDGLAGARALRATAWSTTTRAPTASPTRRKDPQDYGYGRLAEDLLAVLDDRGIDRAVLAGASMGAHTLTKFALEYPERVAALVIMTPAFDPEDRRPGAMDRWDRLAKGLREGGVEGFVEAYGTPKVPEQWLETIDRVLHQRLAAHEHPEALADALQAVPRSRPFEDWSELEAIKAPTVIVASRDEVDPEHPYATGERYAEAISGARLVSEEPGASPAGVAGRAGLEGDQRGGGLCGRRAMSSSAHSTTISRS